MPEPVQNPFVFTIGHSNHLLEHFTGLLERYGIQTLVDARSQPYSRHVPHFNAGPLKEALAARSTRYVYLGRQLGGRPAGKEFYDARGRVQYPLLAQSALFARGISSLLAEIDRSRVAVMCGEENPARCHRRLLVGRALAGLGVQVRHIRGDGRLETEEDLLEGAGAAGHEQLTLF